MIVATMLLGVGVLAVFSSLGAAGKATSVADHRSTAVRVATSELEIIRSWPYDEVGISVTSLGYRARFEGRPTVSDTDMRVEAGGELTIDNTVYTITRNVTWESIRVGRSVTTQGYKLVTVVVSWDDGVGDRSVRQDTGLYSPDSDA